MYFGWQNAPLQRLHTSMPTTPLHKQRPRTCIRPPLTVKNAPCAPSLARKQRHLTQRNRFCHSAFFLNSVELPQRRHFRTKNFHEGIRQYRVCKRNRLTPTALHPAATLCATKTAKNNTGNRRNSPKRPPFRHENAVSYTVIGNQLNNKTPPLAMPKVAYHITVCHKSQYNQRHFKPHNCFFPNSVYTVRRNIRTFHK